MKVLVALRLNGEPQEQVAGTKAKTWLETRLAPIPDAVVQLDSEIDWKGMRRQLGGYAAVYAWASREFDKLVLIEGNDWQGSPFLAKGQHTMAVNFLTAGKGVGVWRDGKIERVSKVMVHDRDDWKGAYGFAVLAGSL